VTRVFLGMQLQFARCHDHPFASWTQKDFYGMTGFFVRVVGRRRRRVGQHEEVQDRREERRRGPSSPARSRTRSRARRAKPVRPKFLGGAELDEPAAPKDAKKDDVKEGKLPPKPAFSAKEKIADWGDEDGQPYFARAMANRLWSQ